MKIHIYFFLILVSFVVFPQQTKTLNTVAILIKFQNDAEFSITRSQIDNMFNSVSSASLRSYYNEVSYRKLHITTYIYPICPPTTNLSYTFPKSRGYFQPYSSSNTIGFNSTREGRLREHEILDSAVRFIRQQLPDTLDLDFNSDGFADNVMFIFAGNTGAWGDVGLWPHSGVLDSYDSRLNNKRVYHYSIHLGNSLSVGTFCHETFHVFGAPDLYRYFVDGTPVGSWDIMASGKASMGTYMKYKYTNKDWISSIPTIEKSGTYSLSPISSDTNNCFKIKSPYSETEFFILEYRKKEGLFESSIPGSGLLIYRINTLAGDGNSGGPPDEIYIYRKGGTPSSWGVTSNANFSSSVGRTAINDYSTDPKSFLSDGSKGGLDIRNIGSPGSTISFDVKIVNCNIITPADSSVFLVNAMVDLEAIAVDSADIVSVEFYKDNELISTVNSYPYKIKWQPVNTCLGKHTIKAKAISISGVTKTDSITVYVTEAKPLILLPGTPDSLVIAMEDSISLPVTIVNTLNPVSIVNYYIDSELINSQLTAPFSFNWKPSDILYGNHILRVEAIDTAGKTSIKEIKIKIIKFLLSEGFERGFPPENWSVNSTIWGWYHSPKGQLSGDYCAATRNYHAMGEAVLETPSIFIDSESLLEFYWMDRSLDITSPLIAGYDSTYCEISVNGGNYSMLKVLSSEVVQSYYQKETIDLSSFIGDSIKIRWRDISDESLETQGTALDDISITSIPSITGYSENNKFGIPSTYELEQNFPNPFNPSTSILYSIPKSGFVTLTIYDLLGNEVKRLINQEQAAGQYKIVFNADNFSSGVYFYRLNAENISIVKKMLLLK